METPTIEKIFNEMNYNFEKKQPTEAFEWIKENSSWINYKLQRFGSPPSRLEISTKNGESTVEFIPCNPISNEDTSEYFFEPVGNVQHWQMLARKVEENSLIFAQLDALQRNVLFREVIESDIPYFVTFFRNWVPVVTDKTLPRGSSFIIDEDKNLPPLHQLCFFGTNVYDNTQVSKNCTLITLLFMKLAGFDNIKSVQFDLEKKESKFSGTKEMSAALVFANVDVDSAADGVLDGTLRYHGKSPLSLKRVLVQEAVYSAFVRKLTCRLDSVRVGTPFNKTADTTKITDPVALQDAEKLVGLANEEGFLMLQCFATIGNFFKLTFIVGRPNCFLGNVCRTPVATIESFRTIEEGLKLLNNSQIPVTSVSVWTESYNISQKVVSLLQAPVVWINAHGVQHPSIPYGIGQLCLARCITNSVNFDKYFHDTNFNCTNVCSENIKIKEILPVIKDAQQLWGKTDVNERLTVLVTAFAKTNWTSNVQERENIFGSLRIEQDVHLDLKDYSVIISHKPRGVLIFHAENMDEVHTIKILLKLLSFGNSVIVTVDSNNQLLVNAFVNSLQAIPQTTNIACVVNLEGFKVEGDCKYEKKFENFIPLSVTKSVWFSKP